MGEQTTEIQRAEQGVAATLRETGRLSDTISATRLPDGRIVLAIAMGIDETDADNPDWPTEGFAEITLPAEAWEALRSVS